MNNKGFTLIELLAVLVILAIIALIAVPTILNIVNSSKNKANEVSVNNYIKAVNNSLLANEIADNPIYIKDGKYSVMSNGNLCIGTLTNNTCTGDILKIDIDGEHPKGGSITIVENEVISVTDLTYDSFSASMSDGEITILDGSDSSDESNSVCTLVSGDLETSGSEVECGGESFYVIPNDSTAHSSAVDGTVSLLAAKNITLTTTNPTQSDDAGTTDFSSTDYWQENGECSREYIDSDTGEEECEWYKMVLNNTYSSGFVYETNEFNNLYQYVNAYKEYLNNLGANIIDATIPSNEQLSNLGIGFLCDDPDNEECGNNVPSWLLGKNYWTGSVYNVYDRYMVLYVLSDELYFDYCEVDYCESSSLGIRPVIIVNKSDIQ